jgi:hypothetical protein
MPDEAVIQYRTKPVGEAAVNASSSESAPHAGEHPLGKFLASSLAGWLAVLIGVILRARRYFQDRGVMHDEAQLAINVITKSFGDLIHPLDIGDQASPVGFVLLQKTATILFGTGEWSIRLIPFLASIIALPLFLITARRIAGPTAAFFATLWLALAEHAIYYGAEGKQYSFDLLCTIIILYFAIKPITGKSLAILTAVGALLIWFSFPILFVLAGVGIAIGIELLRSKCYRMLNLVAAMGFLWLGSFLANYLLITRYYAASDYLVNYWDTKYSAFAPLKIASAHDLMWYPRAFIGLFEYPLGITPGTTKAMPIALLATIAFILGGWMLIRRASRTFWILAITVFACVAASALKKYPFAERQLLFLMPLLILPLAATIGGDWRFRCRALPLIRLLAAVAVFVYPTYLAAKYLAKPPIIYDAKPALKYVRANWQQGDVIYLHWGSDVLGSYYLEKPGQLAIPSANPNTDICYGTYFPSDNSIADGTRFAPSTLFVDIFPLHATGATSLWIVFSMDPNHERAPIDDALKRYGGRLAQEYTYPGGCAQLYDISGLRK